MFSGIVEEAAQVVALQSDKGNLHLTMKCSFVNELKIDQSVAHNGVCLTVVSMTEDTYTVTAIKETLERSNLGNLKVGDKVNLEHVDERPSGRAYRTGARGPDCRLCGGEGGGRQLVLYVRVRF